MNKRKFASLALCLCLVATTPVVAFASTYRLTRTQSENAVCLNAKSITLEDNTKIRKTTKSLDGVHSKFKLRKNRFKETAVLANKLECTFVYKKTK